MSVTGYLRLFRVSVAFTPVADVTLGYAVGRLHAREPLCTLSGLAAASLAASLVFCSAVAFNDVIDRRKDRSEAPGRPIPSGAVPLRGGVAAATLAGLAALVLAGTLGAEPLIALASVLLLALLYDFVTRRLRWLGVANLGLVRAADVCFGMVCAGGFALFDGAPLTVPGSAAAFDLRVVPLLYGLYAVALSGVALGERERSPSAPATIGFSILAAAAAVAIALPALLRDGGDGGAGGELLSWWALFCLLLLLFPLLRRLVARRDDVAPIVGHLVSGYLLVAAVPVAAFLSPPAAWLLAALFVVSRLMVRLFPPA